MLYLYTCYLIISLFQNLYHNCVHGYTFYGYMFTVTHVVLRIRIIDFLPWFSWIFPYLNYRIIEFISVDKGYGSNNVTCFPFEQKGRYYCERKCVFCRQDVFIIILIQNIMRIGKYYCSMSKVSLYSFTFLTFYFNNLY